MKRKPVAVLGAVLVLASLGIAAPAQAAESVENQLLQLNPGLTVSQLRSTADATAKQNKSSREAVYASALREAKGSAAVASIGAPAKLGSAPVAASSGGGAVYLGSSKRNGDIFVSPASTLFINHGHTGIFYNTGAFVHAPGAGKKSRTQSSPGFKVGRGAVKQEVNTTSAKRTASGNYARASLLNKPYNNNFAFNKNATQREMNCSQLVWAAYKLKAKIDLDGNGGFGVYPYNIKDSKYTKTYKTL